MTTTVSIPPTQHKVLIDLPMPILTPRLLLRPAQAGDGPDLNAAIRESHDDLRLWLPFAQRGAPTLEDSEAGCRTDYAKFLLRERIALHLYDRESGELVGSAGMYHPNYEFGIFEIGYWVRKSRARRGYVTEAINAVTRYAFAQLGAKRVIITCNASHAASRGVPERLGFPMEGTVRNADFCSAVEVQCRDDIIYARTSIAGLPELEVSW